MNDPVYRLPPWQRSGPVVTMLSSEERDWGLRQFRVPQAWQHSRGAGVRIAVLDTGIDTNHVDLQEQILAAEDFTGSPYGVRDIHSHGTHCAGIIAAREDGEGIVGMCPDLSASGGGLLVAKVLGDDGVGHGDWVAKGVHWARTMGARVISMSLGSSLPDPRIQTAIEQATAEGSHVICAAGNDGIHRGINFPGRLAETIAVAAVGRDLLVSDFSSRGTEVDIAAPGEDILSTVPGDRWVRLSGTSMATPFVAGVVALACAIGTIDGVDELRQLLYDHATDAGELGRDTSYGAGLLRPDTLLESVRRLESPASTEGLRIWIPGAKLQ